MSPRACQPTRKKILIWSKDRSRDTQVADWLHAAGYETAVYPDVHDIVAVCAAEMPNLVVLGDVDVALLDRLDEDHSGRRTPVLILSDRDAPPTGIAAARACLTDWMAMPANEDDLIVKVRAILRVAFAESVSTEPPERDSLTKLYNRRYFDERLEREIERARRYGRKLTCVMIDVDDFQGLNNRYGHRAGDMVLRSLGDFLLSTTRCSDIIARFGGQEFALLLPETPGNEARMLAERIRRSFAGRSFECGDESLQATLSCGVATYPDHARDAETLVRMSDSAMFQAQSDGGNGTFVAFSECEEAQGQTPMEGPTILIVEDNDYNRSVASLVLRASGYEVIEAGDGPTAHSLVKSEHPDLILVDIQLSGSSGLDATMDLIGMDENRGVPVVALTARDVPVDLEELVRAGCRGYIVKPIDTNNLATQIRSYLKS
ncbi:MAG: diguanylate cyclase [Candidatus Eisenbacteria bacterium]